MILPWRCARSGGSRGRSSSSTGCSTPNCGAGPRAGLDKGEAHHALKDALRIGRQGEIRDRTTAGQHFRIAGLNLLAAIAIHWNTLHLGQCCRAAPERRTQRCPGAPGAHLAVRMGAYPAHGRISMAENGGGYALTRISHQVTAADANMTAFAALNAARVLVDEGDELAGAAPEPVEVEDDEDIAAAQIIEAGGEARARRRRRDPRTRARSRRRSGRRTAGRGPGGLPRWRRGRSRRGSWDGVRCTVSKNPSPAHLIAKRLLLGCRGHFPAKRGSWDVSREHPDKHVIFGCEF